MPRATTEVRRLFERAADLAIAEVERLARKILREHRNLSYFCMGNGSATFDTKDGKTLGTEERAYMKPLDRFIDEWNREFGLTGYPMWINGPDAPVVRHWTTGGVT